MTGPHPSGPSSLLHCAEILGQATPPARGECGGPARPLLEEAKERAHMDVQDVGQNLGSRLGEVELT